MSSLRNFGIALLISLLIFSGVAYFAMGVVADLFAPDEEANVDKGNQNVENYDDTIGKNDQNAIKTGRSFNLLVIGTDRDPLVYNYDERNSTKPVVPKRVKATTLLFVRFDKYCKTCKHEKLEENEPPCDECLEHPVNLHSHKPVCHEGTDE